MRAPVDLPEDYWKALSIMAEGLGKQSRQHLIEEVLTNVVNQNPGLLEEARLALASEVKRDFNTNIKVVVPERIPGDVERRYLFTRFDGSTVDGVGINPLEALKDATGKKWTLEDYNNQFEKYEIIPNKPS